MRLIVGYLATPTGEDGLVLGVQLARSLGAALDICMVVPPDRAVPAEARFAELLAQRGRAWLDQAAASVPDDIETAVHLSFSESFSSGLMDEAARLGSDAIVVGGAKDGLLGRHTLGTVSTELLHSAPIPLALAPFGYRTSTADRIREVTCAMGTRTGADLVLRTAVRSCERMHTSLRLLSLVPLDDTSDIESLRDPDREARAIDHAQQMLDAARSGLPDSLTVTSSVADGSTVEAAVSGLTWEDGDVVVVGSSRLAQPRRLFLGSTASKMLRALPVPMVVVPSTEFRSDMPSSTDPTEASR
ncbi:universal stress protein [Rhodococcus sp. NBC_00294]|uniref:universal stress protein n=1 Tax=Rhodococcus sp. NBC_00294 TaxID=2976004 RepID=UPI002E2CD856|nr:universal stress protein [Rhodococcus sp. NBC_00294]